MTKHNELLFPRRYNLKRNDGRVAAYMRMSTDDQRYSLENQENVIRGYAALRKLELVRFYVDPGRSGLDLKGASRPSKTAHRHSRRSCRFLQDPGLQR